jgi:predicted transcriptional regulator
MEFHLKAAIDLAAAQARVRAMSAEETLELIRGLSRGLKALSEPGVLTPAQDAPDPRTAVRERSILCLESGKPFRVLTRRHLAKFGLTPEEYRTKWGYPPDMPLVCKALQRERRKRMRDMRLWEKRRG